MEASGGGGAGDVQQQKQQQQTVPPQPQLHNDDNNNRSISNSSDAGKATFRAEVKQNFETLVKQGLEPNDAAALALKIAAKIGKWGSSSSQNPPRIPPFPSLSPLSMGRKKSHVTLDSYLVCFFLWLPAPGSESTHHLFVRLTPISYRRLPHHSGVAAGPERIPRGVRGGGTAG